MTDLEPFKPINDRHGHRVGDECPVAVAGWLVEAVEPLGGWVARDGGEEFAVVLPGLVGGAAERVGEPIRSTVASRRAECHGMSLAPTGSAGMGELAAGGAHASPAALVRAADAALYRAKAGGRDRVCRDPAPLA